MQPQKAYGQQGDQIFVKKFDLGLQERIDTGLMPAFYNIVNIYGSSLANLKGETDIAPVLISRFMTGFVRGDKEWLIEDEEKRVEEREQRVRKKNGGAITNEERGRIRLEESVETATETISLFDEAHERRQAIGMLISPKDMKGLRSPPVIPNLNDCEAELIKRGVTIVQSERSVGDNEDMYDEEVD